MRDIQREQSHLDNQNRLSDLALQLMQLDIAAQRLAQELTQNQQYRDNEMRDLENSISRGNFEWIEKARSRAIATERFSRLPFSRDKSWG